MGEDERRFRERLPPFRCRTSESVFPAEPGRRRNRAKTGCRRNAPWRKRKETELKDSVSPFYFRIAGSVSVHVPSVVQVDVQVLDDAVVRIDIGPGRSPELAVNVLCTGGNDDSSAVADVELEHGQKYELIGFAHLAFLSLVYAFIIPCQIDGFRSSPNSLCSFG